MCDSLAAQLEAKEEERKALRIDKRRLKKDNASLVEQNLALRRKLADALDALRRSGGVMTDHVTPKEARELAEASNPATAAALRSLAAQVEELREQRKLDREELKIANEMYDEMEQRALTFERREEWAYEMGKRQGYAEAKAQVERALAALDDLRAAWKIEELEEKP